MLKNILNVSFLLIVVFVCACTPQEQQKRILSPNGKLAIEFNVIAGKPLYWVEQDSNKVILPSQLGFELNDQRDLSRNFTVKRVTESSFDETWEQVWGEEVSVRNHYNEMRVELQQKGSDGCLMNIVFRAFDDGIAFRYEFPKQKNLQEFEIINELTEFTFFENASVWSIPTQGTRFYESYYTQSLLNELDTVFTPITIETSEGQYMAIHEANLTDYAEMTLIADSTKLNVDLIPWSTGVKVYAQTPFVTPWRTLIIADDLNELVNSRIMLNLNEPCQIEDTSWIQPMKFMGIWWGMHLKSQTWFEGPKHGATTQNAKRYIDFAADHHIGGLLVEGWNEDWKTWEFSFVQPYSDFDMDEVSKYAQEKGVQLIGHHETGGNTLHYEAQMDEAFDYYRKHGVHAVKTGYVGDLLDGKERHGSQYGVRHYRKVIEKAADYQIAIDNHEPVMPTGLQRTFPNLMTQEGVRGQEYDAWSEDGGNRPDHTCILPFTRGLAGPMDFTQGIFNFKNPLNPQARVQTTLAKQLALFVVIYTPLQMAADLPGNYENKPAFQFIEKVPTDWSQSLILDGKIGDYVVTARKDKHSEDWFLGAITDENARELQLDFSFLDEEKTYIARIFKDAKGTDWKSNPQLYLIEEKEINVDSLLDLYLAPSGGTAIWLKCK